METIQITRKNAMAAYKSADAKTKPVLEALLGKEFLSGKITDRVKNFDDVLDEYGPVPANMKILLDYNGIDKEMLAAQSFMKISMVGKVLNEDWVPNWKDNGEPKWYPWFYMNSGSGVSFFGCIYDLTRSDVGSRLCYKTEELAKYAATQFSSLYKDLFIL